MNRKLNTQFDPGYGFKLEPVYHSPPRAVVEKHFVSLKEEMLAEAVGETERLGLDRQLRQAANEAAGLAWTTQFPLLVFPALFAELAQATRVRASRADVIRSRSQIMLEHSAC